MKAKPIGQPSLDPEQIFKDYKEYTIDRHNFLETYFTINRVIKNAEKNPNSTLSKLGISMSVIHSKLKTKENGLLSMFIYIDSPIGLIELQMTTEMRLQIQVYGPAAHVTGNKAPYDIDLSQDPNTLDEAAKQRVLEQIKYGASNKTEYRINKDNPSGPYVEVVRFDPLMSYEKTIEEIDYSDPNSNIQALKVERLKQKIQAFRKVFGFETKPRSIKSGNIRSFISSSLKKVEKMSKTPPTEVETLRYQKPPKEGNYKEPLLTFRATEEEINQFFRDNPELDPVKDSPAVPNQSIDGPTYPHVDDGYRLT